MLSVLAFHFGVPELPGGFVGVDVFFVISGYLMTRIVADDLDRGRFSVAAFYAARTRRIVPPLLAMLVATTMLAAAIADPHTVAAVARAALLSLLFVSNVGYAAHASYLVGLTDNWLLHSWTLSVEWQFYLLYPWLLMGAARIPALWRRRATAMALLCAVSTVFALAACLYSPRAQVWGFFLLPTRAWEMLAGGWIAFLPAPGSLVRRRLLAAVGQALILVAILLIRPLWGWPSAWTLVPVAGAALVLLADAPAGWLGWPPVRALGRWSYSIYLWHWPLASALGYLGWLGDARMVAVAMLAALGIGGVSYRVLERPRSRAMSMALVGGGAVATGALLLATAFVAGDDVRRLRGLSEPARIAALDYAAAAADFTSGTASCPHAVARVGDGVRCEIGLASGPRTVLIGDSHVEQLIPRLIHFPGRLTILYREGCAPLPDAPAQAPSCRAFLRAATAETMRPDVRRVVLLAYWEGVLPTQSEHAPVEQACLAARLVCTRSAMRAVEADLAAGVRHMGAWLAALRGRGVETVVVGPELFSALLARARVNGAPGPEHLFRATLRTGRPARLPDRNRAAVARELAPITAALGDAARSAGARLIDPLDDFCRPDCVGSSRGRLLFHDGNHFRTGVVADPAFAYIDRALSGDVRADRASSPRAPAWTAGSVLR